MKELTELKRQWPIGEEPLSMSLRSLVILTQMRSIYYRQNGVKVYVVTACD